MKKAGTPTCCALCGRWGNRGFVQHGGDGKNRVCSNDRACSRRRESDQHRTTLGGTK